MRKTTVVVLMTVCLSRMTKVLTEVDGPSWREKLPPLPTVPLAVRERAAQAQASSPVAAASQQNGTRATSKPGGLSSPPHPRPFRFTKPLLSAPCDNASLVPLSPEPGGCEEGSGSEGGGQCLCEEGRAQESHREIHPEPETQSYRDNHLHQQVGDGGGRVRGWLSG